MKRSFAIWILSVCLFSLLTGSVPVFGQEEPAGPSEDSAVPAPEASPTPLPAAAPDDSFPEGPADLFQADFGGEPTYIKSESLTLRTEDQVFLYNGNVEVRQGDMILTADQLEGKYDKENQIESLVARSNVVIVKGENVRATAEKAIYEREGETMTLTENPELQQGPSILAADKIIIYLQENRSAAEGAVRVKVVKEEEKEGKRESRSRSGKKKGKGAK